ncbi:hypothetical protein COHA_009323 [Chlorella ohadii]|uniref:Uncharacterized protein n=1 Tax=Chlorella ohadii TaxID=2649997 RepID=A0AAD5DEY8_9CHLO|nr:hypothetical protein COHA_009323 [Chlorella ohadii]
MLPPGPAFGAAPTLSASPEAQQIAETVRGIAISTPEEWAAAISAALGPTASRVSATGGSLGAQSAELAAALRQALQEQPAELAAAVTRALAHPEQLAAALAEAVEDPQTRSALLAGSAAGLALLVADAVRKANRELEWVGKELLPVGSRKPEPASDKKDELVWVGAQLYKAGSREAKAAKAALSAPVGTAGLKAQTQAPRDDLRWMGGELVKPGSRKAAAYASATATAATQSAAETAARLAEAATQARLLQVRASQIKLTLDDPEGAVPANVEEARQWIANWRSKPVVPPAPAPVTTRPAASPAAAKWDHATRVMPAGAAVPVTPKMDAAAFKQAASKPAAPGPAPAGVNRWADFSLGDPRSSKRGIDVTGLPTPPAVPAPAVAPAAAMR